MSEFIYSKVNPELLLHVVNRKDAITHNRNDISPSSEYLQVSCFRMNNGKTFRPHKHITHNRQTDITQESWIVVKGRVKAILYDIDDKIIREPILEVGDCSITFRGGHNYLCMEDDSIVYEYKTGPYTGQEKDKTFIQ
jgi:cupin fold WbuC family metalloprotein